MVDALGTLLQHRFQWMHVEAKEFAAHTGTKDQIIDTNRLILILDGDLEYTVEKQVTHLVSGAFMFVPAWVRRRWVSSSKRASTLIWCEFDDGPEPIEWRTAYWRRLSEQALTRERQSFSEMLELYQNRFSDERLKRLCLEGLLKGALARFWYSETSVMEMLDLAPSAQQSVHYSIKQALEFIAGNYCQPDVLERLYAESDVSAAHLRRLFQENVHCCPRIHIQRLRMRRARYLLRETGWQQKRIARETGYDDPLYFSRLYHRYWGCSPSADRNGGK